MQFHDRRNEPRGPSGRRTGRTVTVQRQKPVLGDESLEAMSQSCPDCKAEPYEPCHPECSSHWT